MLLFLRETGIHHLWLSNLTTDHMYFWYKTNLYKTTFNYAQYIRETIITLYYPENKLQTTQSTSLEHKSPVKKVTRSLWNVVLKSKTLTE